MKGIKFDDPETIKKLYRIGAIGEKVQSAELHPILVEYLAEKGAIPKKDYLKLTKEKLAKDKLAVIRHLWSKGYISRFSLEGDDFIRVHRKGIRPGEDRTQYVLKVVKKDWKPKLSEIIEMIEFAGRVRKELIVAYVYEDKIQFLRLGRSTFE